MQMYKPVKSFKLRPGLYLENGRVMHEGEEFCSIGVNYFGAFVNELVNPQEKEIQRVFKQLKDNGIRYFRANWGLFWPVDYAQWADKEDEYFAAMDRVVALAEQNDLGIICSFFWHLRGISDYYCEPACAWGDRNSRTRKYMLDYMKKVIGRYKESPAIYMWEFSNEFNLTIDLPNRRELRAEQRQLPQLGVRLLQDDRDDFFTEFATPLLEDFGRLCREFDPYDRLITSGNGEPRPTQYAQRMYDLWPDRPDSRREMAKALLWHNPDPLDCVSIHSYDLLERFPGSESYEGLFTAFMEESSKLNKALFIGEFHGLQLDKAKATIDAIVKTRVPLSAAWAIGRVEYTVDSEPETRDALLKYIKGANAKLSAKG